MIYSTNKYKQNKAILRQATKVMRNLQKPNEISKTENINNEQIIKDRGLSTYLENHTIDKALELNISSDQDYYSDFSEKSLQNKYENENNMNEKELIKNIERKIIKANRNKNIEKQRLSVNHSAHLLDSTKNIGDNHIEKINRK